MSRALQTVASLVVLAVLAGTPAAAVLCAALCAPETHSAQADHAAHHPPLSPPDAPAAAGAAGSSAADCHGGVARDAVVVRAESAARCADGASGTLPSVRASRQDHEQVLALLPSAGTATLSRRPPAPPRALALTSSRPLRPVASSPVLRI